MAVHRLNLIVLKERYAVARLASDAPVPAWVTEAEFWSLTRTSDELSVVCQDSAVPKEVQAETGWRCLRVAGQIPFTSVGVLASLTEPLAAAGIGVFALSTFDTDYLRKTTWTELWPYCGRSVAWSKIGSEV